MAAEEKADKKSTANKMSKKIKIIIAVLVLLLIIGGGVAFYLFNSETDETIAGEKVTEKVEQLPPPKSLYYRFDKAFIISVDGLKRQRYLMVKVVISSKQQQDLDTLTMHAPVIKNNLNQVFDVNDLSVLQTDEGRQKLNQAATTAVRSLIQKESGSSSEAKVLFTGFVMQ